MQDRAVVERAAGNRRLPLSLWVLMLAAGACGTDDKRPNGSPDSGFSMDGAMLAGPIAARLQVSSSNTNVQLSIDIFDQAPDGTQRKISHGSILGSLRRTDAQKSWSDANGLPTRPYLTLDQDEPLTPGVPILLDVPLWPTVYSIEPGHRIVVRIAPQPRAEDCGNVLGVPHGCSLTQPQQASLTGGVYTLSRGAASFIHLPLLEHGALTSADYAVSPTAPAAGTPLPVDW
jgi:uncharacterized protein